MYVCTTPPVKSPHADLTWTKGAKRLMANLGRFAEILNSFDEQEVPSSAVLESLSPYLEDNTLNVSYHKSLGHPEAVLQICQWVVNVMRYVRAYVFVCTHSYSCVSQNGLRDRMQTLICFA